MSSFQGPESLLGWLKSHPVACVESDSRPGLAKSWSVAEIHKLNTNRVCDDLNKNFLGCRKAFWALTLWYSPLSVVVAGGRWWWYPLDICFVGILSHYTVHSPPTVINFIFVKFWIMLYRIVWRRKQITLNFSHHHCSVSSTRTANANTLRFSYPVTLRGTVVGRWYANEDSRRLASSLRLLQRIRQRVVHHQPPLYLTFASCSSSSS